MSRIMDPGPPPTRIRLARPDDLAALPGIELVAGAMFRELQMDLVAGDDPGAAAELAPHQAAGRVWVAVDGDDRPVGYLLAEVVDGRGHVEQVSVDPAHAGQGIGRRLIEAAAAWAGAGGLAALTLTTYTDVPWNGPYYERLGFRRLDDAELTPGLRRIRAAEAAHGLDAWPRCAMRRDLT